MKGFSRSNVKYMRSFAQAWPDPAFGQQPVGQIPWGHNLPKPQSDLALENLKDPYRFDFLGVGEEADD